MRLDQAFDLAAPIESVWALLDDLPSVAACVPGATAEADSEGSYKATMAVRLGPVQITFNGHLEIVERDDSAYRTVIRAQAKDAKGQGSARSTTTAELTRDGSNTRVTMVTDLQLTGRVAQMGRGMVQPVANDLLGQAVENLATILDSRDRPDEGAVAGDERPSVSPIEARRPWSPWRAMLAMMRDWFRNLVGIKAGE